MQNAACSFSCVAKSASWRVFKCNLLSRGMPMSNQCFRGKCSAAMLDLVLHWGISGSYWTHYHTCVAESPFAPSHSFSHIQKEDYYTACEKCHLRAMVHIMHSLFHRSLWCPASPQGLWSVLANCLRLKRRIIPAKSLKGGGGNREEKEGVIYRRRAVFTLATGCLGLFLS